MASGRFSFSILNSDNKSSARTGVIHTPHGLIETPAFIPVGTQASVKSLTPQELKELGVCLFFVNTYHVYLRPGVEVIEKFGGLHNFMGWAGPLITDSGGFQVYSLGAKRYVNISISESAVLNRDKFIRKMTRSQAQKEFIYPDDYRQVGKLVKIDEEGVSFASHWDGSTHRFSPEISIALQHKLGADIMIAFDECPPYPTTYKYASQALVRTHRWAKQSVVAHQINSRLSLENKAMLIHQQALYGVVQGGVFEDLRKESAKVISSMEFDGIAIGGVAVGESKEEMANVLKWVRPLLPQDKPLHLLGVGEIDDIFAIVEKGIDTFDCVQPTRLARMGRLFCRNNPIIKLTNKPMNKFVLDIIQKKWATDPSPIDAMCTCYTCKHFSRAYLHHLFRVRELLGYRLATIHNLHFILSLTGEIRNAINQGTFLELKRVWNV